MSLYWRTNLELHEHALLHVDYCLVEQYQIYTWSIGQEAVAASS